MDLYSTKNLSSLVIQEIKEALNNLHYGSVEIYVTNGEITQITKRVIKKTARAGKQANTI